MCLVLGVIGIFAHLVPEIPDLTRTYSPVYYSPGECMISLVMNPRLLRVSFHSVADVARSSLEQTVHTVLSDFDRMNKGSLASFGLVDHTDGDNGSLEGCLSL